MRKHRLAERLLLDVIGLDWEDVHIEACRWEHVMSEAVERRIVGMLSGPLVCPHGNPIPGLDELGVARGAAGDEADSLVTLTQAAHRQDDTGSSATVLVERISEQLQPDAALMHRLSECGLRPGSQVKVSTSADAIEVWSDAGPLPLERTVADHIFVRPS
jgi:DtxR family Mn-dependent transcriptional regulator